MILGHQDFPYRTSGFPLGDERSVQSLEHGAGCRRKSTLCTHPMKEDVKKKIILPALKGDASVVTCIQPCLLLRGVFGFAPLYRCVFPRRCQPQLLFPCRRFHLTSSKSTPFGSEATQAKTLA